MKLSTNSAPNFFSLTAKIGLILMVVLSLALAQSPVLAQDKAQAEPAAPAEDDGAIRLGAGPSATQIILAELTAALAEMHGLKVKRLFGLSPEVMRAALEADRLDVYWEYTGQALVVYHRSPDRAALTDQAACYKTVAALDRAQGLIWGQPAPANLTYGLLIMPLRAEELNIKSLADLTAYSPPKEEETKAGEDQKDQAAGPDDKKTAAGKPTKKPGPDNAVEKPAQKPGPDAAAGKDQPKPKPAEGKTAEGETGPAEGKTEKASSPAQDSDQAAEGEQAKVEEEEKEAVFKLGLDPEFLERPDGYPLLAKKFEWYFTAGQLRKLDSGLLFEALAEGQIDVAFGPLVDSRLTLDQISAIQVKEPFFPAYNPAAVWRQNVAEAAPRLKKAVDRASLKLDNDALNKMIYQVEVEQKTPAAVVRAWLKRP